MSAWPTDLDYRAALDMAGIYHRPVSISREVTASMASAAVQRAEKAEERVRVLESCQARQREAAKRKDRQIAELRAKLMRRNARIEVLEMQILEAV